jgi:hypothetical protein
MLRHAPAALLMLATAGAAAGESGTWVDAPVARALDAAVAATTQFSPAFGKHAGTYPATFESVLDTRDAVRGEFLVARYRYRYASPIGGNAPVPRHDESVTEVLLDCRERLAATRAGGPPVRA